MSSRSKKVLDGQLPLFPNEESPTAPEMGIQFGREHRPREKQLAANAEIVRWNVTRILKAFERQRASSKTGRSPKGAN